MNKNAIILSLLMFVTVLGYSQNRKATTSERTNTIRFEFKEGIQKIKLPNSSSYLTLDIKGRNLDIVGIRKTVNGKTYRLTQTEFKTCSFKNLCAVSCWKDPKTKQCICVSKLCKGGESVRDDTEINGQLEFLSPN